MDVWISVGANDFEFPLIQLGWDKESFFVKKKYDIPYADED